MADINNKVYRNVKALAKSKDMKLADVEAQAGVTTGYLSRKGKRISVETLIKLANALGVSTDELLTKDYETELNEQLARHNLRDAILWIKDFHSREEVEAIVKKYLNGAYS